VSTVHKYLKRAEAAGVSWPLPEDWDEARVEAALFAPATPAAVQPAQGRGELRRYACGAGMYATIASP